MTQLHPGEYTIDQPLVQQLLNEQFPALAHLPLRRVHSTGTVNVLYRLGDDLCVRLPRLPDWAAALEKELRWLPRLAPHLPLRIPQPIARGAPTDAYPLAWAIYRWQDGQPYQDGLIAAEEAAATALARFVQALRQIDTANAPPGGRKPLGQLDTATRAALDASAKVMGSAIDWGQAAAVWEQARLAPAWTGTPVWIHADLLRPNLLVAAGRLHAVIDFGSAGVGDPAGDVIPAWSVFGPAGRRKFRALLAVDESTWQRARGYALHQAALAIPYYTHSNPGFATQAKRTLEEVLSDFAINR